MCEIKVPLPWLKFFNWSLKMQWNGLFRAYCVTFHRAWGMGAKPPDKPNTTLKISRAKGFSLLLILYSVAAYFNFLCLCSAFLENPDCMFISRLYIWIIFRIKITDTIEYSPHTEEEKTEPVAAVDLPLDSSSEDTTKKKPILMVRVENVLHEPFKLTDEVKVIYWQMSFKKCFPFLSFS